MAHKRQVAMLELQTNFDPRYDPNGRAVSHIERSSDDEDLRDVSFRDRRPTDAVLRATRNPAGYRLY